MPTKPEVRIVDEHDKGTDRTGGGGQVDGLRSGDKVPRRVYDWGMFRKELEIDVQCT